MFTILLLIVLYIAFIALGIPDSLFGSAMPAMVAEFNIPLSLPNLVTTVVSGCTVLSSVFSSKVINKFGTAKVTLFSTAMTAIALLGFSFCPSIWFMIICAIPLGLGAGAVDAGLNNYIALHFGGSHMNFLHCFYGIGVIVSPYLMSLMIRSSTWRNGYRISACIQMGIAFILLLSLPLWKMKKNGSTDEAEDEPSRDYPLKEMIKNSGVRAAWLACFATNAVESLSGLWGAGYLVYSQNLSADMAAELIMFYYAGMTAGRFLSGVFAEKLGSRNLIKIGLGVLALAVIILALPIGIPAVSVAALFLIGLGNGPIYPNLMNLTPENFGRDVSGAVIGSQMAVAYSAFMLTPPLFGLIAEGIGVWMLHWVLLIWFGLTLFGSILLAKKAKK